LLVTLLLVDGSARLKHLTRLMPASLRYWTVRRMVNAEYWDASAIFDELVVATFFSLPSPADGAIYLIGDKTIKQKRGKKQPLVHKTRLYFALARTRKLADGTHLRDLAGHLPKSRYRRIASYTPEKRRRDYWVFVRRANVKTLGDVTILLSKRRRNDGPKHVKLIVTNLDTKRASEILNAYARRWAVEVTFKELKSGLHWGQMQVTKEKERVKRAMILPVMAYVLLLRLYGKEVNPDEGFTIFRLKRRFCEETWQEQLDRSEAKWRKKTRSIKGGGVAATLPPVTFQNLATA